MELGAFSVSQAVKDIGASKTFYEKFGFKPFTGNARLPTTGPASFVAVDPDRNPILVDQHV